jgi:3',5'-cyclic-AMP phosphodiesterase
MLIAQISDPHVLAPGKLFHAPEKAAPPRAGPGWSRIDTAACLACAVVELNALAPQPDVVVVTGDLVEHGSAAEYEHLRALLAALVMPVFVIPGNHDSREGMREAFGREGYLLRAGFLHYAIEEYPLRIVALDTHIPGEHGGLLCAERLAWFASALSAAPERPTVVLMHHPPFATGIAHMDR